MVIKRKLKKIRMVYEITLENKSKNQGLSLNYTLTLHKFTIIAR